MKVRDVMTSKVEVIGYSDPVRLFLEKLDQFEISGMPVVDADGRILGVATMTDVGKGVQDPPLATESDRDFYDDDKHQRIRLDDTQVSEIMTEHVVTVAPEKDLTELTQLMTDSGIHRVFVVAGEEIVGVVTSLDLVRTLGEYLTNQSVGAN
jgi:CBS-domain-containing membrane protein